MRNDYLFLIVLLSVASVTMIYFGSQTDTTYVYDTASNLQKRFRTTLEASMPDCCKALTKECLSCATGMLVGDFCDRHKGEYGCPNVTVTHPDQNICCQDDRPICKACQKGISLDEYLAKTPTLQRIMIGIPVYNRRGYVRFSSKVLTQYNKVDPNDIFVFDDASTEYDENKLREWYGKDMHYFRSSKRLNADGNTRRLFTYFSKSDYDILLTLDSDLILNQKWKQFIYDHIDKSGVLSLYHSAIGHHKTFNCKGNLCEKKSMGNAGAVMTKAVVVDMLKNHKSSLFDWGWVAHFKSHGIKMFVPKKSLVLHFGKRGQNNGCGTRELARGFDRSALPSWIKLRLIFYYDKCKAPDTMYQESEVIISGKDSNAVKHDVVIVSGYVNCVLKKTIDGLRRNLVNIGKIHVITLPYLVKQCEDDLDVYCHDEHTILKRSNIKFRNKNGWTAHKSRTSWYYQQFLKLFAYQSISLTKQFMIWDADNILLKRYNPMDGQKTRFIVGGWKNEMYSITTTALTGKVPNRNDIVVHQMMIHEEILDSLMVYMCGKVKKESCVNLIVDKIPKRADPKLGFSEYNLYYTWFYSKMPNNVFIDPSIKFKRTDAMYKGTGAGKHCEFNQKQYAKNVYMTVLETKRADPKSLAWSSGVYPVSGKECKWVTFYKNNYKMCIHIGKDTVSNEIEKTGKWRDCDILSTLWKSEKGNGEYVEIGANIGACMMEMIANTDAKITVFEPNPSNLFCLTSTKEGLPTDVRSRITVYPFALGENKGSSVLYSSKANKGNSVVGKRVSGGSREVFDEYHIEVRRYDGVIPHKKVKLMKMDAQGYECNIVNGMGSYIPNVIKTEIANKWLSAHDNCSDERLFELFHANDMIVYSEDNKILPHPKPTSGSEHYDIIARKAFDLSIRSLERSEKKVYSQNGEDGILEHIFKRLGTTNKYYVEFGVQGGKDLRTNLGWSGLTMDGSYEDLSHNFHKEFITPNNIVGLFEKYNVPKSFDLLSIDIDSTDLWVMRNILKTGYKPRVLLSEFNRNWDINEFWTFPNDPSEKWSGTGYFGSSLAALNMVAEEFGYKLLYTNLQGYESVNAFWTLEGPRHDILEVFRGVKPLHRPITTSETKKLVDYKKWRNSIFQTRTSVPECKRPKILPDTSTSKMICMDNIVSGSCIVYSFGINYQWDFDDYMHDYGCTVYSFDPGMDYKSKRAERHFFEKIGLGAKTGIHNGSSTLYSGRQNYFVETVDSIMNRLGHSKVDLLRMDTEGAEFDVLSQLPYNKIGQLSLEIHMWSHSFNDWNNKLMELPLQHLQTYQNTDRINKKTMQEISPGVTRVYEMTFLNRARHVRYTKAGSSIILTSFFTYANDPQRYHRIGKTFAYMKNFYTSVKYNNLNVMIFHDGLSLEFTDKYSTETIKFQKVVPDMDYSTNDFRYITYLEFLKRSKYEYVFFSDISDVIFLNNPFDHMNKYSQNDLFVAHDIGQFNYKSWQVSKCYGNSASKWETKDVMYNAGAWGGKTSSVECILKCTRSEFIRLKHRGNCNMPVLNWCLHHHRGCRHLTIDKEVKFINAFRQDCLGNYIVVHNKCKSTENKATVTIRNDELIIGVQRS